MLPCDRGGGLPKVREESARGQLEDFFSFGGDFNDRVREPITGG